MPVKAVMCNGADFTNGYHSPALCCLWPGCLLLPESGTPLLPPGLPGALFLLHSGHSGLCSRLTLTRARLV